MAIWRSSRVERARELSCVSLLSIKARRRGGRNIDIKTARCREDSRDIASKIVYTRCIYGRSVVAIARVFKSGNSQAVRLPKKFRVSSKELEISRRGDEIILREKEGTMLRALEILAELPIDSSVKDKRKPQRRKGL